MNYASLEQFVAAFGEREAVELTNLESPTAVAVDTAVMDRALADASALIDSYIQRRYALPLASVPEALVPRCLDISRFRLDVFNPREAVQKRHDDAVRWLEQVAKGLVSLGLAEDAAPQERVGLGAAQVLGGSNKIFNLEGF